MKKSIILIILFASCTLCESFAQHSTTFTVDKHLPAPKGHQYMMDGNKFAEFIAFEYHGDEKKDNIVAYSFGNEKLAYMGEDPFFRMMVMAFAEHRPVKISPDAIWLLICQQFGEYVKQNAEQLRDKFVSHDGTMDLVVATNRDLFAKDADWQAVMDDFSKQIEKNTKSDIVNTIKANFTTTGSSERIASEVTLMKVVKPYFKYTVIYAGCGIPSITLEGTPEDWQKVLDKTKTLSKYGLEWWTSDLEVILKEFVKASEGHADRNFWQDIVMKNRPGKVRMGGPCSRSTGNILNGWFVKFFPFNKNGRTPQPLKIHDSMMAEMVQVDFRYIKFRDEGGNGKEEYPMQLLAGIVGIEEDTSSYTLSPKIGWMVTKAETDDNLMKDLGEINNNKGIIEITVSEVPEVFKRFKHVYNLSLNFTGKVVIPKWMDDIKFDKLIIGGKMTEEEVKELKGRFPDAQIYRED
jgi:hypothetical protein